VVSRTPSRLRSKLLRRLNILRVLTRGGVGGGKYCGFFLKSKVATARAWDGGPSLWTGAV